MRDESLSQHFQVHKPRLEYLGCTETHSVCFEWERTFSTLLFHPQFASTALFMRHQNYCKEKKSTPNCSEHSMLWFVVQLLQRWVHWYLPLKPDRIAWTPVSVLPSWAPHKNPFGYHQNLITAWMPQLSQKKHPQQFPVVPDLQPRTPLTISSHPGQLGCLLPPCASGSLRMLACIHLSTYEFTCKESQSNSTYISSPCHVLLK